MEVEDSHGTNSAAELTSLTYLANYLVEVREVEWEIYFHNSLVEVKEDQIIEATILDMISP